MKYLNINLFDIANGPGMRTSLFVTGCTHACPGCFNKLAQDRTVGKEFTYETIEYILESLRPSYMQGLTLLGGEPLDPENQLSIKRLIMAVKREYGNTKDIWAWTGYVYPNDFVESKKARANTEHINYILDNIDVLIDGPFIKTKKDVKLKLRGSTNQRVIDLKKSRKENDIILKKKEG